MFRFGELVRLRVTVAVTKVYNGRPLLTLPKVRMCPTEDLNPRSVVVWVFWC